MPKAAQKDEPESWTSPGKNGSTVLRLEEPVDWAGEIIAEINVRKLRARDLRALPAESPTVGDMLTVAETACALDRSAIDLLGAADALRLLEVIAAGFPSSLGGGGP